MQAIRYRKDRRTFLVFCLMSIPGTGWCVAWSRSLAIKSASKQQVADKKNTFPGVIPGIVFDDSVGDWVVDRFAGNSTAGTRFYQGPAREVGGLRMVKHVLTTPDDTTYIAWGIGHCSQKDELVKVTPDGQLRLVMEKYGHIEGRMEDCRAGWPIWNPKENALYITGPNCLRKIVKKQDGTKWVEIFAGIPGKGPIGREKPQDGPARQATFKSFFRGIVCNSKGIFYWLESIPYGGRLRKIENGVVSTVPLTRPDDPSRYFLNLAMGGNLGGGLLSLGENDDTLYISDYYGQDGYVVLKCDLKTGVLTRFCGVNPAVVKAMSLSQREIMKRYHGETDGPALTCVSGNSGMLGHYDPFHNALWISCPDSSRMRWLKLGGDNWVRTVFGAKRPQTKRHPYDDNGLGIPGEQFEAHYPHAIGFDAKGGVYVNNFWDRTGVWRAYDKKDGHPYFSR